MISPTAVDLVSWDSPEVWTPGNRLRQLLDLLEMIRHGNGLPYFGVFSHPELLIRSTACLPAFQYNFLTSKLF